ncbi:type IV toxin-antitoxin system AbiEi family antitoxin [Flavitalea flava]
MRKEGKISLTTEQNFIVDTTLEQLEKGTGISGKWKHGNQNKLDGILFLNINGGKFSFPAQVRKELTESLLAKTISLSGSNKGNFILIARYIPPALKQKLQSLNIAYLDTAGNIFLKKKEVHIWIEGRKQTTPPIEKGNRAFTKTGLKVVFNFLLKEERINDTYREIAKTNEVGLGNINNIIAGLQYDHFLIKINKGNFGFNNKKELLNKWISAYKERLKPSLFLGSFHFLNPSDFLNWQSVKLNDTKTWWGGEAAGDLLTNYLKPEEITLYTLETRSELIKNYKLIPDEKGNLKAFTKFYHSDKEDIHIKTVPALLAYIDLVLKADRRCFEAAQKIYDEHLQNQFGSN